MQTRRVVMLGVLVTGLACGVWADEPTPAPVPPEPAVPSVVVPPTDEPSVEEPESDAAQTARTGSPRAEKDEPPKPDGRCDHCGSCASVRRVCVAVPVEREKIKVCWSYRCEQICIPGPSIFCGESCECDACGPWWKQWWKPTCAHTITKRVPVKTEVTRKIPGFEWQVQERCCGCNPACSTQKTSWLSCLLHPFGAK